MITRTLLLAVVGTTVVAFVYFRFFSHPEQELTICGKNIEVQGDGTVQGSFYIGPLPPSCAPHVKKLDGGPSGGPSEIILPWSTIPSHGTGGACLIADLHLIPDLGISSNCTSDQECTDALPIKYTDTKDTTGKYLYNNKKREWHGYCVKNTCWTRPGPDVSHCVKSINQNGGKPWPTGSYQIVLPPVSSTVYTIEDMYHELGIDGPVTWRVHACMNRSNGIFRDNTDCGVSGNNRLIDDGPISNVP
jgi:hypothetical protein